MMFIVLCSEFEQSVLDEGLIGVPDKETAEFWKKEADRFCSGDHYIVKVIPE